MRLFLLVLSLAACGKPTKLTLEVSHVDPVLEVFLVPLEEWLVRAPTGNGWSIEAHPFILNDRGDEVDTLAAGKTYHDKQLIEVLMPGLPVLDTGFILPAHLFPTVLAHEIGHALGLRHDPKDDLMQENLRVLCVKRESECLRNALVAQGLLAP